MLPPLPPPCQHILIIVYSIDHDEGTKDRPYGYAVVAGVERYPLKVTRSMGKKKVAKRSKVKPFIKVINYNHMMPTRYALELEQIKGTISSETFKEPSQREDAKKVMYLLSPYVKVNHVARLTHCHF